MFCIDARASNDRHRLWFMRNLTKLTYAKRNHFIIKYNRVINDHHKSSGYLPEYVVQCNRDARRVRKHCEKCQSLE